MFMSPRIPNQVSYEEKEKNEKVNKKIQLFLLKRIFIMSHKISSKQAFVTQQLHSVLFLLPTK